MTSSSSSSASFGFSYSAAISLLLLFLIIATQYAAALSTGIPVYVPIISSNNSATTTTKFSTFTFPEDFPAYSTYDLSDPANKRYNFIFEVGPDPIAELRFSWPPEHHDLTVQNSKVARVSFVSPFHRTNITVINSRFANLHIHEDTVYYAPGDTNRSQPIWLVSFRAVDVTFDIRDNVIGPVGAEFGYADEEFARDFDVNRSLIFGMEFGVFDKDYGGAPDPSLLLGSEIVIEGNFFTNSPESGRLRYSIIYFSSTYTERNKTRGAYSHIIYMMSLFRVSISHNVVSANFSSFSGEFGSAWVEHSFGGFSYCDWYLFNNNTVRITGAGNGIIFPAHGLAARHPSWAPCRAEWNDNDIRIVEDETAPTHPSTMSQAILMHTISNYMEAVWNRAIISISRNVILVNLSMCNHASGINLLLRDGQWYIYHRFVLSVENNSVSITSVNHARPIRLSFYPHMRDGQVNLLNNHVRIFTHFAGAVEEGRDDADGLLNRDAEGIRITVWGVRNVSFGVSDNSGSIDGPGSFGRARGFQFFAENLVRGLYGTHEAIQLTLYCCWYKDVAGISASSITITNNNFYIGDGCAVQCTGYELNLAWLFNVSRIVFVNNTGVLNITSYAVATGVSSAISAFAVKVDHYPHNLGELLIENNTLSATVSAGGGRGSSLEAAVARAIAGSGLSVAALQLEWTITSDSIRTIMRDIPANDTTMEFYNYGSNNLFTLDWPLKRQRADDRDWSHAGWKMQPRAENNNVSLVRVAGNDLAIAAPSGGGGNLYAKMAGVVIWFRRPISISGLLQVADNKITIGRTAGGPPNGLGAICFMIGTNASLVTRVDISGNTVLLRGVVLGEDESPSRSSSSGRGFALVQMRQQALGEEELGFTYSVVPPMQVTITITPTQLMEMTVVEEFLVSNNTIMVNSNCRLSSVGFTLLGIQLGGHVTFAGRGIIIERNNLQSVFSSGALLSSLSSAASSSSSGITCTALVCVGPYASFLIFNPSTIPEGSAVVLPPGTAGLDMDIAADVISPSAALFAKQILVRDSVIDTTAAAGGGGGGAVFFPILSLYATDKESSKRSFLVSIGDDSFTLSGAAVPSPLEQPASFAGGGFFYPSYFDTAYWAQKKGGGGGSSNNNNNWWNGKPVTFNFPSTTLLETEKRMRREDSEKKRIIGTVANSATSTNKNNQFFEQESVLAEEQQTQHQQSSSSSSSDSSSSHLPFFWDSERAQTDAGATTPSCRAMSSSSGGVGRGIFIIDSIYKTSDNTEAAAASAMGRPRDASFIPLGGQGVANFSFHGQLCVENATIDIGTTRPDRGFTFLETVPSGGGGGGALPPLYATTPVWIIFVHSSLNVTCASSSDNPSQLRCQFSNSDADLQDVASNKKFQLLPTLDGLSAAVAYNSSISFAASPVASPDYPHAQAFSAFSFPFFRQHPVTRASPVVLIAGASRIAGSSASIPTSILGMGSAPPPCRSILVGAPVFANITLANGSTIVANGGRSCVEARFEARRLGFDNAAARAALEAECDAARQPLFSLFARPLPDAASSPSLLDESISNGQPRLINISNAATEADTLSQMDLVLVGGNAAVVLATKSSSSSGAVQQQGGGGGDSAPWSSRVDGTVHCFSFNSLKLRPGSPIFAPMSSVLSYGGFSRDSSSSSSNIGGESYYIPCPFSASVSHSESVSIVPLCSSFHLRYDGDFFNAHEAVYRKEMLLPFTLILKSDRDTPAPLAADKVHLPESEAALFGAGSAQSDAFTQFKANSNATGQGASSSSSSSSSSSAPPQIISLDTGVASILDGRVRQNTMSLALSFRFNTQLDRDSDHVVTARFHPALLACRTVPPGTNTSFANTNDVGLVAPLLKRQELVVVVVGRNDNKKEEKTVVVWYEFSLRLQRRGAGLPESLVKAGKTLSGIAAFASAFGGSPMVGMSMSRAGAMAAMAACQFSMEAPLTFIESPMGLLLGASPHGAPQRGAIVGNQLVLCVIAVILFSTAYVRVYAAKRKHRKWMKRHGITEEQLKQRHRLLAERESEQNNNSNNNNSSSLPFSINLTDLMSPFGGGGGNSNNNNNKKKSFRTRELEKQLTDIPNEPKILSFSESIQLSKLPSALVIPASILMHGSVSSAVALALYPYDNNDRLLAALCLLFTLACFAWMIHVIWVQMPRHPWLKYIPRPKDAIVGRRKRFFQSGDDDNDTIGEPMDPGTRRMFTECESCHRALMMVRKDEARLHRAEVEKRAEKKERREQKKKKLLMMARKESSGVSGSGGQNEQQQQQQHQQQRRRKSMSGSLAAAAAAGGGGGTSFSFPGITWAKTSAADEDQNQQQQQHNNRNLLRRRSLMGVFKKQILWFIMPYGDWVCDPQPTAAEKDLKRRASMLSSRRASSAPLPLSSSPPQRRALSGGAAPTTVAAAAAASPRRKSLIFSSDEVMTASEAKKKSKEETDKIDQFILPRTGDVYSPTAGSHVRWFQFVEIFIGLIIAIVTGWTSVLTNCETATIFLTVVNVVPFCLLIAYLPYNDLPSNSFALLSTAILVMMGLTTSLESVTYIAGLSTVIAMMQVALSLAGSFRSGFDMIMLALTFESWLLVPILFSWHLLAHEGGPLEKLSRWWAARRQKRKEQQQQRKREKQQQQQQTSENSTGADEELLAMVSFERRGPPPLSRAGSTVREIVENPRFRTATTTAASSIVPPPPQKHQQQKSRTKSPSSSKRKNDLPAPGFQGAYGRHTARCWDASAFEERTPLKAAAAAASSSSSQRGMLPIQL